MSIGTIVTMGYEIGTVGLVTTLGYGQGAAPPPPPPVITNQVYGPALTQAERNRWFGYYEDPEEEEKRKKQRERAKRLELGIIKALPPLRAEVKPEVVEIVQEKIYETLQTAQPIRLDREIVARIAREISLDLKQALKEGKRLREQRLERERQIEIEEEEEAVEVASLFMLH